MEEFIDLRVSQWYKNNNVQFYMWDHIQILLQDQLNPGHSKHQNTHYEGKESFLEDSDIPKYNEQKIE